MSTEIWILSGVNTLLLGLTAFFVNHWISSIKEENKSHRDDLATHKGKTDGDISRINHELGKRKGETELLRKDVEILSATTEKNFENIKIHMEYQKTSLDEIKESIANKGAVEMQAILELTKKLNKD